MGVKFRGLKFFKLFGGFFEGCNLGVRIKIPVKRYFPAENKFSIVYYDKRWNEIAEALIVEQR